MSRNTPAARRLSAQLARPKAGRPFLHRTHSRKGMILRSGTVARAMAARHWPWGARWSHPDYQHFSSNGG